MLFYVDMYMQRLLRFFIGILNENLVVLQKINNFDFFLMLLNVFINMLKYFNFFFNWIVKLFNLYYILSIFFNKVDKII